MRLIRIVMSTVAMLAMVGVVGACGRSTPRQPLVLPSGTQLVAQLSYSGGFVPVEWSLINAPVVAVYSDGQAVANATKTVTLTAAEVTDLVGALRKNLAGFGSTVEVGAGQHVADANTTELRVLNADGTMHSVSAYALGIVKNYPAALVAANEELTRLANRVSREGKPYTGERVRLVAQERANAGQGQAKPWPAGVPVPSANQSGGRTVDLDAAASAALIAVVPVGLPDGKPWPVFRTTDGSLLGVAWRYLLPHE